MISVQPNHIRIEGQTERSKGPAILLANKDRTFAMFEMMTNKITILKEDSGPSQKENASIKSLVDGWKPEIEMVDKETLNKIIFEQFRVIIL